MGVALTSSNPCKTRPQLFHMLHILTTEVMRMVTDIELQPMLHDPSRCAWSAQFGIAVVQKAVAPFGALNRSKSPRLNRTLPVAALVASEFPYFSGP